MSAALDAAALDQLFLTARTHNGWEPKPLPEDILRRLYDVAKWGPTAANSGPGKVFARNPRLTFDEACRLA